MASWDTWLEEKEETRSSMERLMVRDGGERMGVIGRDEMEKGRGL